MAVRNKLHYLLIKSLNYSKKEALSALESGKVTVNGAAILENQYFENTDSVEHNGVLLFEPFRVIKMLYYKPRGIECTLNNAIPNNLASELKEWPGLFPVGRLDKESEGLLLMTNSGKIYRELNHFDSETEKEYVVKVDKPIDNDFLAQMANGIEIMGKMTLFCDVRQEDNDSFRIVLKQGLNRQIRRMCFKLNYNVVFLQRVRIGTYELGNMQPGERYFISQ